MVEFEYQDMFPIGEDTTEYRLLTNKFIGTSSFNGNNRS
jgi:fumarate hydratase class I